MNTTQPTLVHRVRDCNDALAWQEFYELYSGLINRYARSRGLNDTDASDLVGDCMALLSQKMRDFDYDPKKCRFRSYLKTIVDNKIIDHMRKKRPVRADTADLAQLQTPDQSPDELWGRRWEITHMLHCWKHIEKQIPAEHAEAFRLYVIEDWPVKQVTETLGMTANQVYQVKSRTIQRLKATLSDLLGDEQELHS